MSEVFSKLHIGSHIKFSKSHKDLSLSNDAFLLLDTFLGST